MRAPLLLLTGLLALPATAQSPERIVTHSGPRCVLPVPAEGAAASGKWVPRRSEMAALLRLPATSEIRVNYSDFTAEARVAFDYAVAIWERHLDSPVPIVVDAEWSDLGRDVLGSAGPEVVAFNRGAPGSLQNQVFYPRALADAITGTNVASDSEGSDINASFNSDFVRDGESGWHFDIDTPPPRGKFDFATTVLHELGHGLGFIGTGDVFIDEFGLDAGSIGFPSNSGNVYPFIYDLFVVDGDGNSVLDEAIYPVDSGELFAALTGEDLRFDGPTARLANEGAPPALHAPRSFVFGSSYSHLSERGEAPLFAQSLMTPFLSPGERFEEPGFLTCAIFADLGWALGEACGIEAPPPPISPDNVRVLAVPNPSLGVESRRCVAVLDAPTGPVTASVYDVLGRRLSTVAGEVAEGETGACAVELPALAPGTYLIHVEGEGYTETAKWTVLRSAGARAN